MPQDEPYSWLRDKVVSVTTGPENAGPANRIFAAPVRANRYLRLQFVNVYVRDQERSMRFFVEQLGFTLTADVKFASGNRWIEVVPPDGTAALALVLPRPELGEEDLAGHSAPVTFLTEDVDATYREWAERGVRFTIAIQRPEWGGAFCRFEDPDGNTFVLAGFDEATREIEKQRREQANREEAGRRAAQEMEIARQVQSRLFPQQRPRFASLDYDGVCIQAKAVGGDYFDFLDLGAGRLGLVVGDIAGKGMPAALLMANLQAAIRSLAVAGASHPGQFLSVVNRLLFQNTETSAYATLLFAEMDPSVRRIRFVNCGHVPAVLARANGDLQRLRATGTVLGLFETWECVVAETSFEPGDVLALCTDGITEAADENGEEFGEEGLARALVRGSNQSARELVLSITDDVRRFSSQEQNDDITLIVARSLDGHPA
jgi:serine phosphatase RsbU (regulator of sigma subunit)/predicted enzyme related to lactoylglutathione lyase